MEEKLFIESLLLHKDSIYRYCLMMCRNQHDAEDCTQNTFIKCYSQNLSDSDHIRNWLYKVAHRECLNLQRSFWKKVIFDESLLLQIASQQQQEECFVILQCPQQYRNILYLYYYEGYKQKEIAELLNMSLDAVKKRLTRGKAWLKANMKGETEDDDK